MPFEMNPWAMQRPFGSTGMGGGQVPTMGAVPNPWARLAGAMTRRPNPTMVQPGTPQIPPGQPVKPGMPQIPPTSTGGPPGGGGPMGLANPELYPGGGPMGPAGAPQINPMSNPWLRQLIQRIQSGGGPPPAPLELPPGLRAGPAGTPYLQPRVSSPWFNPGSFGGPPPGWKPPTNIY